MSTEVTTTQDQTAVTALAQDRGKSLEELLGVSTTSQSGPEITRVSMLSAPIKGEAKLNGKKVKVDTHSTGTYKIVKDDVAYYSTELKVRIFIQREQWKRWDSEEKRMDRTVMAENLKGDLMDTLGTFNIGRPAGYISPETYDAMSKAQQDHVKSVKRVKIIYGTVTPVNLMDVNGNGVDVEIVDEPFVMDITSTNSMRELNKELSALARKKVLPIMSEIILTSEEREKPDGSTFGVIKAAIGDRVELKPEDTALVEDFLSVIEYINKSVIAAYNDNNKEAMSDEDADIVNDIIGGDDIEDAEFTEV